MVDVTGQSSLFSVIIPTIWNCPDNLLVLSKQLVASDKLGQLLIMDNQGFDDRHDLLRDQLQGFGATVVRLPYNVLVNPAWNIGICLAKFDRYLLLNDDVQIYSSCLEDMAHLLDTNADAGLVGFATECVVEGPVPSEQPGSVECRVLDDLKTNFGCCVAGRTQDYELIPRSLKLFCGDNWLFYVAKAMGRSNYAISNKQIQHLLSVSSRAFPELANSEWNEFQRLWKERKS